MTHDPLCSNGDMTWLPETAICLTCHVIARVRKDERAASLDAAREAVSEVPQWYSDSTESDDGSFAAECLVEDVLAAIDALREEQK